MPLESVSNTTLLGLYNPLSKPNAYPNRFSYTLGLSKGFYNPNIIVIYIISHVFRTYITCGGIQTRDPTAIFLDHVVLLTTSPASYNRSLTFKMPKMFYFYVSKGSIQPFRHLFLQIFHHFVLVI